MDGQEFCWLSAFVAIAAGLTAFQHQGLALSSARSWKKTVESCEQP